MEWPIVNGGPGVRVTFGLEEKIGMPNFSNITVGPIRVEMVVENTKEAIQAGLKECTEAVEELLVEERAKVLQFVKEMDAQ